MCKKVIFLVFFLLIGSVFSATITIENLSVSSSVSEITIPIKISSEEKFSAFQFDVYFDKEILNFDGISNGELVFDWNVLVNEVSEGNIRIAGFDPKLEGISGNGVLVYVRFLIKKGGKVNMSIRGIRLSDKDGKKLNCIGITSTIQIEGEKGETKENEDSQSSLPETPELSSPTSTIKPIIRNTPGERITNQGRESNIPVRSERETSKSKTYQVEQQGNFAPTSNNCILLVMSEYGNPSPPNGFTTFTKGESVICKVEDRVPISEMEKVVCTGYEGTGAARNGNSNQANFIITEDSKILWKWKKVPMEREFNLKYEENVYIPYDKNKIEIPLSCDYYGGLNSKILFGKEIIPDGIEIEFPVINYEKNKGEIVIKVDKNNVKGGNYKIIFSAFPETEETMKKEFQINLSVETILEIEKQKNDDKTSFLFKSDKLGDFKNFFIEIEKKGKIKIEDIKPEKTDIIIRKNSFSIAGNKEIFDKLVITLSGDVENLKIEKAKFIDKDGEYIKVKIPL
ncbi:MAG TPA: cohesin domain-containing protein [bacterium]|nr:cohesin domain-containing protein [bacterium]